jgi:hypothetical protein
MALVCRDHDGEYSAELEGLYFGGWKGFTACLGYGIYEPREPLPKKVEERIRRGMAELRAAGLVELAPKGIQQEYANKVYRLNIRDIRIV